MSNSQPDRSGQFRLRIPPAETQLALALGAVLLGACVMQLEQFGLNPLLLLMVMFIGGIWAKRAWAIWLLLGTLIYLTYFLMDVPSQFGMQLVQYSDLTVAFVIIMLAAVCFRFLETVRFTDTFYPGTQLYEKPPAGVRFEFPSLLGGRWWAIPLAVFLALFLVGISFDNPSMKQLRIRPPTARLVFLVLLLFFSWFVCRAVIGTIVRWRMKPQQADVHSRSLVAKEFWTEAYAIESRREKQKPSE